MLSKEAVRKHVWLNNGSIKMVELLRVFSISKKDKARTGEFVEIVSELCLKDKDDTLVLKQHYRNEKV